ncbi:hypothetical protein [Pontibacter mangrovi]|uniref:Uncharacterized protein n=1 Tax=Pontibacter mangrovi TaxID=2589816 RepID=A0A501VSF3_9BACT|nr:hypothetical protein [Pontibacter mangrovi]TPE40653.1 hypothetical protein FJM65_20155 [Pontibacter mangrovi]
MTSKPIVKTASKGVLYKPKVVGAIAILTNILPSYWSYFFIFTIPVVVLGVAYIFVKPTEKLIYEIPAGMLLSGSLFGSIITYFCIIEMFELW